MSNLFPKKKIIRVMMLIASVSAIFAIMASKPVYAHSRPLNPCWATACEVRTTDAEGNPKVEFAPAETTYIHWSADGMINMTIYAPDGVTVDQEWTFLPSCGIDSFVPSHGNGIYEIECTGAPPTPIAVGTILVIPQLPLGTQLPIRTMFGAVFVKKKRRSH